MSDRIDVIGHPRVPLGEASIFYCGQLGQMQQSRDDDAEEIKARLDKLERKLNAIIVALGVPIPGEILVVGKRKQGE